MKPTSLDLLPTSPVDKTGWPWNEASESLPPYRPDGSPWPRITIITPSYNQGEFIEETIRSILLQGYPNLEYMVFDGGSTDSTLAVLESYGCFLDHWHSGADKGQADAVNRGLEMATGEWFQFINSDDVLAPGCLKAVGLAAMAGVDAVAGHVLEFSSSTQNLVYNTGLTALNLLKGKSRSTKCSWHQPGLFMRTIGLKEVNGFPIDLNYAFDFFTTVRYLALHPKVVYADQIFTNFRVHNSSKTSTLYDVWVFESIIARERLFTTLTNRELGAQAAYEAAKWKVQSQLFHITTGQTSSEAAIISAAVTIKSFPRLLADKIVLSSVRRNPIKWLKASFSLIQRPY